ncbi:hypothetical protein [Vallitalea guaymasensis]|uniref:hypothetical protein n=1 Tax=Vallitalea guaymasensis TaxID=1185412 RepID=UPI002353D61E|nr:hypothetical protein [Vallitalea guaymasensis]
MSDIPTASEVIENTKQEEIQKPFKLGIVKGLFENKTAKIQFDGEENASEKQYSYLADYKPAVNDRVLLARVADTYIVINKINYKVEPPEPPKPTNTFSQLYVNGTAQIRTLDVNGNAELQGAKFTGGVDFHSGVEFHSSTVCKSSFRTDGSLGFFNRTPTYKRSVRSLYSSDNSSLKNKINEMITVLNQYGLF